MSYYSLVVNKLKHSAFILPRALQLLAAPCGHSFASYHTTRCLAAKIFKESENTFSHNVMVKSGRNYQLFPMPSDVNIAVAVDQPQELPSFILDPPATVDEISPNEILNYFRILAEYCRNTGTLISDERFNRFVSLLESTLASFNDEQLEDTFRLISIFPAEDTPKAPNFVKLWNTLDFICSSRIENWPTKYILYLSDAFYYLNLTRISKFAKRTLRRLGRDAKRLSPEQLVQSTFLLNLVRQPLDEMIELEVNLARCANILSLEELGVVSLGFFKTKTQIRDPELLKILCDKLIADSDTVKDITLVSILKILRYSSELPQAGLLLQLLNKLKPQIHRFSLLSCLHIALLGSDLQCCDDEVLEIVLNRFDEDPELTRLKDMERICFVLGVFNLTTASGVEHRLCTKILPLLRTKMHEILLYPRCFNSCLQYLTLRGYYDMDLLSAALNPKFLKHTYGSSLILARDIFQLDTFVKVNLRDSNYTGNQLDEKKRREMAKHLTKYIPERNPAFKLNTTDRTLLEMKETTDLICKTTVFKHILPNFERPDIVICWNKTERKAVKISPDCPKDYSGVILTRKELLGDMDRPEIEIVAIVVAGWNNVVRDKKRNTGLFDMKLKQLQILGYKYILIYWHEWRELENKPDRVNFIKRKLGKILNS